MIGESIRATSDQVRIPDSCGRYNLYTYISSLHRSRPLCHKFLMVRVPISKRHLQSQWWLDYIYIMFFSAENSVTRNSHRLAGFRNNAY